MINKNKIKHEGVTFIKCIENKLIMKKILELSSLINEKYKNKNPLFIGVLNGSIYFMMDLINNLSIDYEIDFIKVSSYKGMVKSKLKIIEINNYDICNKDLIIVEDIVDTGETMKLLIEYFIKQKPNSINIVSMFMRSNNKIDAKYKYKINWCGFKIEDKYIIGYGLDYNNLFRNLKDVYIEYEEK